jgi:heme oxygenase (staphylobilin-producing)
VITATFIFKPNNTDGDFKQLDDEIMRRALANNGFIKKEKWVSPDADLISVVYYFRDSESLKLFSSDEVHREAKQRYAEWYDGYRVEIAEITGSWGDGQPI